MNIKKILATISIALGIVLVLSVFVFIIKPIQSFNQSCTEKVNTTIKRSSSAITELNMITVPGVTFSPTTTQTSEECLDSQPSVNAQRSAAISMGAAEAEVLVKQSLNDQGFSQKQQSLYVDSCGGYYERLDLKRGELLVNITIRNDTSGACATKSRTEDFSLLNGLVATSIILRTTTDYTP